MSGLLENCQTEINHWFSRKKVSDKDNTGFPAFDMNFPSIIDISLTCVDALLTTYS